MAEPSGGRSLDPQISMWQVAHEHQIALCFKKYIFIGLNNWDLGAVFLLKQ